MRAVDFGAGITAKAGDYEEALIYEGMFEADQNPDFHFQALYEDAGSATLLLDTLRPLSNHWIAVPPGAEMRAVEQASGTRNATVISKTVGAEGILLSVGEGGGTVDLTLR